MNPEGTMCKDITVRWDVLFPRFQQKWLAKHQRPASSTLYFSFQDLKVYTPYPTGVNLKSSKRRAYFIVLWNSWIFMFGFEKSCPNCVRWHSISFCAVTVSSNQAILFSVQRSPNLLQRRLSRASTEFCSSIDIFRCCRPQLLERGSPKKIAIGAAPAKVKPAAARVQGGAKGFWSWGKKSDENERGERK